MTLIEILVAMVILSVAVVTLVGAMTSLTIATQHHRGLGATDTVVRDFGESVKKNAIHAALYTSCPTAAQLNTPAFAAPAGYTTSIDQVEYWIPVQGDPLSSSAHFSQPSTATGDAGHDECVEAFELLCPDDPDIDPTPECDSGVQRVTLTATATKANERGGKTTTEILLRRGNSTGLAP